MASCNEISKNTRPGDKTGLLKESENRCCAVLPTVYQCNRYRRGLGARQGELQQATTGRPFTKIHVVLTGPHVRSKNGFVYLLTVVDYFTQYLICFPFETNVHCLSLTPWSNTFVCYLDVLFFKSVIWGKSSKMTSCEISLIFSEFN